MLKTSFQNMEILEYIVIYSNMTLYFNIVTILEYMTIYYTKQKYNNIFTFLGLLEIFVPMGRVQLDQPKSFKKIDIFR